MTLDGRLWCSPSGREFDRCTCESARSPWRRSRRRAPGPPSRSDAAAQTASARRRRSSPRASARRASGRWARRAAGACRCPGWTPTLCMRACERGGCRAGRMSSGAHFERGAFRRLWRGYNHGRAA
eukprot:6114331-Prymnesium_polylepis.1